MVEDLPHAAGKQPSKILPLNNFGRKLCVHWLMMMMIFMPMDSSRCYNVLLKLRFVELTVHNHVRQFRLRFILFSLENN